MEDYTPRLTSAVLHEHEDLIDAITGHGDARVNVLDDVLVTRQRALQYTAHNHTTTKLRNRLQSNLCIRTTQGTGQKWS